MALDPDLIRRTLREAHGPLGVKDLIRRAGLHPGQQTEVKRVLRELVRSGELLREGKRFREPGGPRTSSPRTAPHSEPAEAAREWRKGPKHVEAHRSEAGREHGKRFERGAERESPGEKAERYGARGYPEHQVRQEPRRFDRSRAPTHEATGRDDRAAYGRIDRGESRGGYGRGERGEGAESRGGFDRGERGGYGRGDRGKSRGGYDQGTRGGTERGSSSGGTAHGQQDWERSDTQREERPSGGPPGFERLRRGLSQRRGEAPTHQRGAGRAPPPRFEREPEFRPAREPTSRRPRGRVVEGILEIKREGIGFVRLEGEDDVFLPEWEARKALHNDRVRVEVDDSGPRPLAYLVEVVDRRREQAVGAYLERPDGTAIVVPRDSQLREPIRVPPTQIARSGDVVRVRLGIGRELLPGDELVGEVSGSLGEPGAPSQEVLSIAFAQGFSDQFPPEVMDEADGVSLSVPEEALEGRRDLRKLPLVTIDGADARDFDDAVYAERTEHGFKLWVAIADVTHYVREHRPLDEEALKRATSVYLPDRVLPMLPERLSNGICSLRPDEDRLCLVAEMELDRHGHRKASEIYPAVMRSQARCTYDEVQAVLDGQSVPHRDRFREQFQILAELAKVLHAMRARRGAIDFDLPEVKVEMGEKGFPARMVKRERKESHRLIEECMLAANEAVATFFHERGLPTVYRFHGEPDEEKIATFAEHARAFGFRIRHREVTSKELNDFIQHIAGHPEQRALNQMLLRSMMQAVYSAQDVGHYGLAAEYYLHFTSPIRRYPDLVVHRLLKKHWGRSGRHPAVHELDRETERLTRIAEQSSERERAAMQVEREVVSFYAALMMKDRVGEEFEATVSGVTDFGFFVELDQEHIEGLVKLESLGFGGHFDERKLRIVFADGRTVKVGEKVKVRLASVNLVRRQIDFTPLEIAGHPLPQRPPAEEGAPRAWRQKRTFEEERPRRPAPKHFGGKKSPGGKTQGKPERFGKSKSKGKRTGPGSKGRFGGKGGPKGRR